MKINPLVLMSELDKKPKTISVLQMKTVIKEDGSAVREMKILDNEEVIKTLAEIYGTRTV